MFKSRSVMKAAPALFRLEGVISLIVLICLEESVI